MEKWMLILLLPLALGAVCENPVELPAPKTCADISGNCVEVRAQNSPDYEYYPEHNVFFFPSLSNEDHYFLLMEDINCEKTCAVFQFEDGNRKK